MDVIISSLGHLLKVDWRNDYGGFNEYDMIWSGFVDEDTYLNQVVNNKNFNVLYCTFTLHIGSVYID